MAHYAKVLDGIVVNVIVAEEEFIRDFVDTSPGEWIQTSYNTRAGVHQLGGTPLRKNHAAVGGTYDRILDAFIPPKAPFCETWVLNEETCVWEPPVDYPDDGEQYKWNDETINWELISEDDSWMDET
jgi:hypothetical protein